MIGRFVEGLTGRAGAAEVKASQSGTDKLPLNSPPPLRVETASASGKPGSAGSADVRRGRPSTASEIAAETKTGLEEANKPETEARSRPAGDGQRPSANAEKIVESPLQQEIRAIASADQQWVLTALFRYLDKHNIKIQSANDSQGMSTNLGTRTMYIDFSELRARPENVAWSLYYESQHIVRPTISPTSYSSAEGYVQAMLRHEFEVSFDVVARKHRHEEKRELKSEATLPLEKAYREEYDRQSKLTAATSYRQLRQATFDALWEREGPAALGSSRKITLEKHYREVYETYHRAVPGEQEKALELLMAKPLDQANRANVERTLPDEVRTRLQEMLRSDKLGEKAYDDILLRWVKIMSDRDVSRATKNALYMMSPERVIRLLDDRMQNAYELYSDNSLIDVKDQVVKDLLPYIVCEPGQSDEGFAALRAGWQRLQKPQGYYSLFPASSVDIPVSDEVRESILKMDRENMRKALLLNKDFVPFQVKADGKYSSVETERYLVRATLSDGEYAQYSAIERRIYGDDGGQYGIAPETLRRLERLKEKFPTTHRELLLGQLNILEERVAFADISPTSDGETKSREHEWELVKLFAPETRGKYFGNKPADFNEVVGSKAARDLWDSVEKAVGRGTRKRLLETDNTTREMLKYSFCRLGEGDKLSPQEIEKFAGFCQQALIWADFRAIMPLVVPKPVERDYSKPIPPRELLQSTLQELVHGWLKYDRVKNPMAPEKDFIQTIHPSGIFVPVDAKDMVWTGQIGTGRWNEVNMRSSQLALTGSSAILFDFHSGERDAFLRTLSLILGETHHVVRAQVNPLDMLLNMLRAIKGAKGEEARKLGAIFEDGVRRRAEAFLDNAIPAEKWGNVSKQAGGVAIGAGELRQPVERAIEAALLHLRTTCPDAPFSEFARLLRRDPITNVPPLVEEILSGSKSPEAVFKAIEILKYPPAKREEIYHYLSLSVDTFYSSELYPPGRTHEIIERTNVSGISLADLIGRLDKNNVKFAEDAKPVIVVLDSPVGAVMKHFHPMYVEQAASMMQGAIDVQKLRQYLKQPYRDVQIVSAFVPSMSKSFEAFYSHPWLDVYPGVLVADLGALPGNLLNRFRHIAASGMSLEDAELLCKRIGAGINILEDKGMATQNVHNKMTKRDNNTIGWQGQSGTHLTDITGVTGTETAKNVITQALRPEDLIRIVGDKVVIHKRGGTVVIGERINLGNSVFFQQMESASLDHEVSTKSVPGVKLPEWYLEGREYSPPRPELPSDEKVISNIKQEVEAIEAKVDQLRRLGQLNRESTRKMAERYLQLRDDWELTTGDPFPGAERIIKVFERSMSSVTAAR